MQYNLGDSIKMFAQIGSMKKPRWIAAKYLDDVPPNNCMVEIHGQSLLFDKDKIRKYIKIAYDKNGECPDLIKFQNNHWDYLKKIITPAMDAFHAGVDYRFDEKEKAVYAFNDALVLSGGVIERESIVSFFETTAWCISITQSIGGSYWEPPSEDSVDLGSAIDSISAAKLFVDTVWKCKCEDYWNSVHDKAYCESLAEYNN